MEPCLICRNTLSNEIVKLRELQLGLNKTFTYQLCANCYSLCIVDPPANLTPYYPSGEYYSFVNGISKLAHASYLRKVKTNYLLFGRNRILGRLLSIGYNLPEFTIWVKELKAQIDDKILDVGCGNGMMLGNLHKMGFTRLTGIDPFITEEKDFGVVKIYKKELWDIDEKYDVIMMHHVLEHMQDPLRALKKAYSLLNEDGSVLVRLPIMGNYGWQNYGEYWAGLDAPRHFFIPSENGMRILVEEAGFVITKVQYDTVDYLIWCSEQYKKGMSLYEKGSHMLDKKKQYVFKKNKSLSIKKY